MKGVIFTPNKNVKRADYTGAFLPEARGFADEHGIDRSEIIAIDIADSKAKMRAAVCRGIHEAAERQGALDTVAFFCHGWKEGMQLGFKIEHIPELSQACKDTCTEEVVMPFYACSTARDDDRSIADDQDPDNTMGGDGGFADEVRDGLCADAHLTYCRVVGHVTAGHSTFNPWVRLFDGAGMPYGGTGGYWIVRPKGPLWRRWFMWLREQNAARKDRDNQFKFPFMSLDDIRAAVVDYDYKKGHHRTIEGLDD